MSGGEGAVISPTRGIAQITNSVTYCYYLPSYQLSIVLSSLLRGRIIAGISSKSEVLSQLRAKEDSYTVLKGWNITTALGERNPHFYKNGPWVHSGAPRARVGGAPLLSKSTHPRKFGNHVTVH